MPSNYLPPLYKPQFCEWLENFKIEFGAVASSLGFSGPEVLAVLNDCNWALFACRSAGDASSFGASWTQYRDGLLTGDPNVPVGTLPGTTTPTQPATPAPVRGIVTRLRATVKRIKGSPAYTPAMGETLRIVASSTPIDPATAKPKAKAKPLPMFASEVGWGRLGFPGVLLQSLRDGEDAWNDLGIKTGSKHVDDRPPLVPGKPEVRSYRTIFVRNDQPVGLWSDVVTVTVQP